MQNYSDVQMAQEIKLLSFDETFSKNVEKKEGYAGPTACVIICWPKT